jgi:hypothetical protein
MGCMPLLRLFPYRALGLACAGFGSLGFALADDDLPQPMTTNAYDALLASSPFTRTLGVSDSLILTGLLYRENEVVATLLDTQTFASQVVGKTPNLQGWQLVGVGGDATNRQTWTAQIRVQSGEIVSIRYQAPPQRPASRSSSSGSRSGGSGSGGNAPPLSEAQMREAQRAAENYREGFSADGYPRSPPPEMVAKLSRLSVSQREEINRRMFGLRNQGLGLDERRRIYEGLVDRAGQQR